MPNARKAHITITADVSDYLAKLEQIRDIVKELKACGVDVKDIPAAVVTAKRLDPVHEAARKLAQAAALSTEKAEEIIREAIKGFNLGDGDADAIGNTLRG